MAPSYKHNDPRGFCGDSRRGAALGRSPVYPENTAEVETLWGVVTSWTLFTDRVYVRKVRMYGDYDENGTYFGATSTPLWWCATADYSLDAVYRVASRENAKAVIRRSFPNARFFR